LAWGGCAEDGTRLQYRLHDLPVLFDVDGKTHAVCGATTIRTVDLNSDCTGLVPRAARVLFDERPGMGGGSQI
jgi:hypothetical protein